MPEAKPDLHETRTKLYWNSRANTVDNQYAEYFRRHGGHMHSALNRICNVDYPNELHLPEDAPILFAANHRSFLDIAVAASLFSHFDLTCRFQVQARMFTKPVVGKWLTNLGCIPTNRATKQQAEDTTVESLLAGHTVAVMPEGRLVPPEERPLGVGPGRLGISRIVERTGAVVIPVACTGSGKIWPRGRPVPKTGLFNKRTLRVRFGEPLAFTGNDHQANVDELMATIGALVRQQEIDVANTN